MSNLYDRPLPLIPRPQKIELPGGQWKGDGRSMFTDSPDDKTWVCATDRRAASRLLRQRSAPIEKRPEAYVLRSFEQGAVVRARDAAGVRHGRTTFEQLKLLASDQPLPQVEIQDWPDLAIRGIHLDLKYMMHRVDYLNSWLESLASYKINTLLLEYEDKFPYRQYPVLRHKAAFSENELRAFLARARSLGLRVIPLIQTHGHVEYVLKHPQFAYLRNGKYHNEYNVRRSETLPFVCAMIDEMLEFHGEDEWFHVGGDECWSLKKEKPEKAAQIYVGHVIQVLAHVLSRGKRPLLWDDMIRMLPQKQRAMALRRIPKKTVLCYWNYSERISDSTCLAVYRRAGFDVIGIPCHDWGPIVPYYAQHTVPNTLAMIRQSLNHKALGVINSHWACFHCPLPLQDYGIALTADRSWKIVTTMNTRDFDEAYCRLKFGIPNRIFVEALYQMGGMLEMPTNLGRPIFLPYYYYMDAVLYFPRGNEDREQYGPVVPDGQIDFSAIVRKKLAHLKTSPKREASLRGLGLFRDESASALALLRQVRSQSRRSQPLVDLVELLAKFRIHAANRMLALANTTNRAERKSLLRESKHLRADFSQAYRRFVHPHEMTYEEASLFSGEEKLLAR